MNDLCAVALGWGMSWDLFWDGEMSSVLPYYQKWKNEHQTRQIQNDLDSWVLGKYIQVAVASVLSKDVTYPSEPFYLEHLQKEQKTAEEIAHEQFVQLDSWKRIIKQNIRNEKKER